MSGFAHERAIGAILEKPKAEWRRIVSGSQTAGPLQLCHFLTISPRFGMDVLASVLRIANSVKRAVVDRVHGSVRSDHRGSISLRNAAGERQRFGERVC